MNHSHISKVEWNVWTYAKPQTGDLRSSALYKARDALSRSTRLQGKYTSSGCALLFHSSTPCHVTCKLRNKSPPLEVAHPDRPMTFFSLWEMASAERRRQASYWGRALPFRFIHPHFVFFHVSWALDLHQSWKPNQRIVSPFHLADEAGRFGGKGRAKVASFLEPH